ncbi:MAG: glycosyltransferase [Limnothrix sp. RL_2_0]|nr:glycosyltransferase [Limnothrix sp. RL_2_0]
MKESSEPLVSILINNYNYGHFIEESIKSALSQSYPHCEVIVVDDGSTDNSKERIQQFSNSIISVFQENQGQASAYSSGFHKSTGEIILFLDSDDYFYSETVQKIVNLFSSYPDAAWIFYESEYVDINGNKLVINHSSNIKNEQYMDLRWVFQKGGKLLYNAPRGMCFRRSLLEQILPMPQSHGVSISDVYLRTAAMILSPGLHSPQKLAVQRIHDRNTFTFRKDANLLKSEITIKTSYYLRQKFPDPIFDKYMNKSFIRSLAQSFCWIGIRKTLACSETKLYFQEYLSVVQFIQYIPRFFAYLIKFSLEKKKS